VPLAIYIVSYIDSYITLSSYSNSLFCSRAFSVGQVRRPDLQIGAVRLFGGAVVSTGLGADNHVVRGVGQLGAGNP